MPYKSRAQAAKFNVDPKLKPMAKEWNAATPNIKSLPKRVRKTGKAKRGG